MRYLDGLDEAQKAAVLATDGPVAVIAGAGSGKTRVLTHRIAHLMALGVPGDRILAVTFTNKAAKEMRERALALIEKIGIGGGRPPMVSTFHALGVHILRAHGKHFGLPKWFTIYDRNDSLSLVKQILKDVGIDPKETEPRAILSTISKERGDDRSVREFLAQERASYFMQTVGVVWEKYDAALRKESAVDFDDLIALPLALLRENDAVRETLASSWDYLHIDEYQDTNRVQSALAEGLGRRTGNIFVVGDIDQSIYSWRGATIENLLSFEKAHSDATVILLERNYRSTKTIVEAANAIIEKNRNRKEKTSYTENEEGERITLVLADTEDEEAREIARRIRIAIESGTAPEDIAVLYRTNFQSRALEDAFLLRGIPYQVLGTRFFERKEVKDALSYLRLALVPNSSADISRVANTPARGIGKVTLLALLEGKPLSGAAAEKVAVFRAAVEACRDAVHTKSASEAVRTVLERSGLTKAYENGNEEDRERLANLKELATLAARFDHLPAPEGIASMLADATLMSDQDTLDGAKSGVRLMTVHAAKGLEFGAVFVAGMEEGLFPIEREDAEDEEEERRLFYVAVTRAHRALTLSFARVRRVYGALTVTAPSSFLKDLPDARVRVDDIGEFSRKDRVHHEDEPSVFYD